VSVRPTIPHADKLSEFYQYVDAHPTLSQREIGEHFGIKQAAVSRRLTARKHAGFTNGEPVSEPETSPAIQTVHPSSPEGSPTTALQRVEYRGEPGLPTGLPDIARQSDLDEIKTRVSVLEAFIATLQQQPPYFPGSPGGSPTVHPTVHPSLPSGSPSSPTHKRGFVMADDLFEAIHTYASSHHLQVKDVVDTALRRFFAEVGEGGHDA
jgi:hypothetical protein